MVARFITVCLSCVLSILWLTGCGFMTNGVNSQTQASEYHPSVLKKKPKKKPLPPPTKKMDILFVVNANPELMDVHLTKVKMQFKGFISALSSVDWKIGLTNADYDPTALANYRHDLLAGKIMPLEKAGTELSENVLYPHTSKPESVFLDTLKRYEAQDIKKLVRNSINPCRLPPYCHSQVNNPVQSLIQAISVNPGFFRQDSHAVAVIFTNGDESALATSNIPLVAGGATTNTGGGLHNNIQTAMRYSTQLTAQLVQTFQRHYGTHRALRVYSISIIPNDQYCLNQVASLHPQRLAKIGYSHTIYGVVAQTKGRIISICSANYSHLAQTISEME